MHTFLSLNMDLIPQETKDNIPNFWNTKVSEDGSCVLIDGYNPQGELVITDVTWMQWLQWEANPEATKNLIVSEAIEYTREEMFAAFNDVTSVWYSLDTGEEDDG